MFGPFGNFPIKKPEIRTVTLKKKITVPVSRNKPADAKSARAKSHATSSLRKSSAPASLQLVKNGTDSRSSSPLKRSADSTLSLAGSSKKRKASAPVVQKFSDSEDTSESDDADLSPERVRVKSSTDSLPPDVGREIWTINKNKEANAKEEDDTGLIHGKRLVKRDKDAAYKSAFPSEENIATLELRYPGSAKPERFSLVEPVEHDGYKPLEDILETIERVLTHYFPASLSSRYLDDSTGIVRRLKRAIHHRDLPKFRAVLTEYDTLIRNSLSSSITTHLTSQHHLPLPLIERILSQIYARTVSPQVSLLRDYENGTDNVYGELLPRFSHQIFAVTGLNSSHTFVDLGSGVGNVVLQAALETGAESWGIEMMPNPCKLGEAQAAEFPLRCRKWGIRPGKVTLVQGDFLTSPAIDTVLRRADVVLVNNQAFLPTLNDKLIMKFLDLKDGCRIVSLKSFVDEGHRIQARNIEDPRNVLTNVKRLEYWSGSVSWTDQGGSYFVAVKDSSMVREATERMRKRARAS
ncbi:DOT1-domain-containing protein [Patellaria atrata CBS 101060]|uniref:Histone-lysine N-methyltransferase, H3 lysine-79 specific n=1 Tax=Patellaria atrata CBS 101060 TaxID=1346257 RepID=A0A9P4SAG0_9PEZI|nr:DOT1-domain-containing protein [Patellaria atrata CBS 101060]